MKYCSECGHGNADEVKFCEACGHGFEVSAQPTRSAVGHKGVSATLQGASKALVAQPRTAILAAVGVVGLLVVAIVVWLAFFRPLSPSDYEMRAEDHLAVIADGLTLVGDGVSGVYSYAPEDEMTTEEYADYRADIDEGIALIENGARGLRSLRAPAELRRADGRLKTFADYMLNDYVQQANRLINDVEPGMSGTRLDSRVARFYDQGSRGQERAWEGLMRAADDIYIPESLLHY